MELQCVESLGLECSPAPSHPLRRQIDAINSSPFQRNSSLASLSSQSQQQLDHHPHNFPDTRPHPKNYSPSPCTHALSPLTRSPSPSPKRRRICSDQLLCPVRLVPRPKPVFVHPLTRLCDRDVRYVVQHKRHLQNSAVTPAMREEVVAWCSDVVIDLDLPEGVVAIATNIFDRFISRHPVEKKAILFVLTASCLLLACKIAVDDHEPQNEISSRANVPLSYIHDMEDVMLNALSWDVNVVTPHEVVNELNVNSARKEIAGRQYEIQDSLMLNAMLDYALAGMRATSVGVACYIISENVAAGVVEQDHKAHDAYELASRCGVNLAEVDFCVERLRAGIDLIFDGFENVDSDAEET